MAKPTVRVPLYTQIREYVLDKINKKVWKPGDRLPSENEFAAQFDVSRITVKNALSQLIDENLIYRVQGKGSFVSTNTAGEPIIFHSDPATSDNKEKQLVAYLMPRLENTFTAQLLNGIENELTRLDYRLIYCKTYDSQEKEKQILREVIELGVKGIIIFPVDGETYNEEILRLTMNEFPLVVVDRYLRGIETNCVCSDNVEGARIATAHLISHGHSRIGFVSTAYQGTTSIEDRLIGYEKALAECNIPVEHRLRQVHFDAETVNSILKDGVAEPSIKEEIQSFLQQNSDMTAIFAINAAMGLTVIDAAKEMGISVPEKLSVIFFDNYELAALSAVPPTCVSQKEKEMGEEAARLLVSIMHNPKQERRKIITSTKLIERKSVASNLQTQL
ncbi:GntR family transcriptional regulator [Paenibacillus psychroresistens]|uniref:GntR family transcriptional regulator n=1 Tax=Paenibacillus psychroresistens TaxID=1778678 RepID=A0A6B8RDM1_9BACL|nr:GntR family transcriptional regulator [Paenibacillus psychroresistens]QGQ94017.1 GntR family transcriptional regulator [Paenibacillus psychroresistens]